MSLDINTLPISGGVLLTALGWAAISALVLGPLAAHRTIEATQWPAQCAAEVRSDIAAQAPPRPLDLTCNAAVGLLNDLLNGDRAPGFGAPLPPRCGPLGELFVENIINADPHAAERQRLDRVAARAPSACACAADVVAGDRIRWGLYAGSARLLGGPRDIEADLTAALHGPHCARVVGQ